MLRHTTDFIDNAIAIDPTDCGCTDCIVGNSIPLHDTYNLELLAMMHFATGRKIINRSSRTLLIYINKEDEACVEALDCSGPVIDTLQPSQSLLSADRADYAFYDSEDDAEDSKAHKAVVLDRYAMDVEEAVNDYYFDNANLVNCSDSALVLYRNFMSRFTVKKVDTNHPEKIIILAD